MELSHSTTPAARTSVSKRVCAVLRPRRRWTARELSGDLFAGPVPHSGDLGQPRAEQKLSLEGQSFSHVEGVLEGHKLPRCLGWHFDMKVEMVGHPGQRAGMALRQDRTGRTRGVSLLECVDQRVRDGAAGLVGRRQVNYRSAVLGAIQDELPKDGVLCCRADNQSVAGMEASTTRRTAADGEGSSGHASTSHPPRMSSADEGGGSPTQNHTTLPPSPRGCTPHSSVMAATRDIPRPVVACTS